MMNFRFLNFDFNHGWTREVVALKVSSSMFLVFSLLFACVALAQEPVELTLRIPPGRVPLAWDPPVDGNPTNYVLFAAPFEMNATNFQNASQHWSVGTVTNYLTPALKPGTWHFVVTAEQDGFMSEPSNDCVARLPGSPSALGGDLVTIQTGTTVTNFADTWFMRVKFDKGQQ